MRELVLEVERPEFIYAIGQSMGLIAPGPFGLPFAVPDNRDADLLLVGMGTSIAPFRAFVKHLCHEVGDWRGRLFYGARSGL